MKKIQYHSQDLHRLLPREIILHSFMKTTSLQQGQSAMGKYRQVDKEDMENADEILSCFQKSLPHAFS